MLRFSHKTGKTTREGRLRLTRASLISCVLCAVAAPGVAKTEDEPDSFVLIAGKALTAADGRGVVDDAVIIVRDGKIESVSERTGTTLPADLEVHDVRPAWVMPGLVDLHCHIGGSGDINDAVYQTNPGLRVYPAVIPDNPRLELALSAGVTTVLFIPGSATNIGGQGILMKAGQDTFEECVVRMPGSLKIAQGDNPTRWGYGMRRALMAHHVRTDLRQGRAYARRWDEYEKGAGPKPERNLRLDVYRDLFAKRTQVSTHTQYYHLVLTTLTLIRGEFGLDVYIDHGSFDSFRTAPMAERMGVAAILGPREVLWPRPPRFDTDGRAVGSAAGFQARGHTSIGFNTDSPVVPQEELSLQAAMGCRYGMNNDAMEAVRGLTIVPARAAGIDDRVGSLEAGKDADILVLDGDPADPRTAVRRVFVDGVDVYDSAAGQRW